MTRIVEARIRGLRALADVTVELGGLTVLIGDNGTGKSSILEALRMASLAVQQGFYKSLRSNHVLIGAVSSGTARVLLRTDGDECGLTYGLEINEDGLGVEAEVVFEHEKGPRNSDWERDHSGVIAAITSGTFSYKSHRDRTSYSLFEMLGFSIEDERVDKIRRTLAGIDCHLPFEVSASWAMRATGRRSAMRAPQLVEPSQRLELLGSNLASVYQTLKNSGFERWSETLEFLQLGIGPHLRDVQLKTAAGGHVSLALELHGVGEVPAYQLSDGQLTYLAFVALVQLDEGRTLLCFDEPEQHLHPALLGRVVQLLVAASERYPVVLATHSDRILDFLPDPVSSVRVCELDDNHQTVLRKLDGEQLDKWLTRYRGLGEIRAAGQLDSVLAELEASE